MGIDIALLLLLAATASDLAVRTVPNWFSVVLGIDGVSMRVQDHMVLLSILGAGIVFVLALTCWRRDIMGGADVKLLTAVSLLVRPPAIPTLIVAIALAGGVLGLLYWMMPRLLAKPSTVRPHFVLGRILRVEHYRIRRGCSLPYVVAITAGSVYAFSKGFAT